MCLFYVFGLMSGISVDGIDVVLFEFFGWLEFVVNVVECE